MAMHQRSTFDQWATRARVVFLATAILVTWLVAFRRADSSPSDARPSAYENGGISASDARRAKAGMAANDENASSAKKHVTRAASPNLTEGDTPTRAATHETSAEGDRSLDAAEALNASRAHFHRLDALREREHVDAVWAREVADAATISLSQFAGAKVASVECGSTLCLIKVHPGDAAQDSRFKMKLIHKLGREGQLLSGGATAYSDGENEMFYFARGGGALPSRSDPTW